MARKKNKVISKFSSYELGAWLEKTEKRISMAQNGKDFDVLKPIIIRMLVKIKKNPHLSEFEPAIVLMLKEVNLNLQFIRRNDDCWALVNNGHSKEALDEIIHALKDLNNHLDKHMIRPEIKGNIIDSIKKISELVESEVKILDKNQFSNLKNQTIKPSISISNQKTVNTFKPKIETLDPFDINAPKINPFNDFGEDSSEKKDHSNRSETYFQPNLNKSIEDNFKLKFDPFPKNNNAEKLFGDNLNSINTYWEKDEKEGQVEQNKEILDEKTRKISHKEIKEKKSDKKKKNGNSWPQIK
ncbi:MAG: hypothetical protein ACTSWX_02355, partial [Promethearchaeota archaeon]